MILTLVIVYLIIVLLSYFYCNLNKDYNIKSPKFIIVLSAAVKFVTKQRVTTAIRLKKDYPNAKIIACGKFQADYMRQLLEANNVTNYVLESKSTNTYEDAIFAKKIINNEKSDLVLVTSPTHQRRAFHVFKRIFRNKISNQSSSLLGSYDSILMPTGWISILIEGFKDIKYNLT